MAAGGQTLGTFGYAKLNGTVVLLRPGATQQNPWNPDIPAPINGYGGFGALNWEQGLNFHQWSLPCVPLDNGTTNWLSASNLNNWFGIGTAARTSRPIWDSMALSTFVFSDNGSVSSSQGVWNGQNVKGGGFTLVGRKGQGIGMQMRFSGTSAIPETNAGTLPSVGQAGIPCGFNRISFIGGANVFDSVGVTGFQLNYDSGLTPNMELDGTYNPVEFNAGAPSCTLSVEFNALNGIAPPGWDPTGLDPVTGSPTGASSAIANAIIAITAVAGGSATVVTFNLNSIRIRDPRNRQGTAGRVSRSHTYDCLAGISSWPLAIS